MASRLGMPDLRGQAPLLIGLGIDAFGSGCAGPLMLLFYVRVAEIELSTAGVMLSLATAFSIVIPAAVGHIVDRVGPRAIVVGSQIAQGIAFLGLLFARSLPLLFLCALVAVAGARAFWSSIFSLLADVGEVRDRDRWYGLAGMMQAAGAGLGGLAAGALLAIGGDTPFLVAMGFNAITYAIAAVLLTRVRLRRHQAADADEKAEPVKLRKDLPFVGLTVANTVLALCSMMIGFGLPLYVAEALPAPEWIVGVLLAGVSVVLATGQTLVVRLSEPYRRTRVLVLGALLWSVWGVLMAGLFHLPTVLVVPMLILGTLVFAAADLLHAATSNALAAAAAPDSARGRYLSYWQYSWTFGGVIAPAYFAWLFDARPDLPWLVLAVLAVLASAAVFRLESRLPVQAVSRR